MCRRAGQGGAGFVGDPGQYVGGRFDRNDQVDALAGPHRDRGRVVAPHGVEVERPGRRCRRAGRPRGPASGRRTGCAACVRCTSWAKGSGGRYRTHGCGKCRHRARPQSPSPARRRASPRGSPRTACRSSRRPPQRERGGQAATVRDPARREHRRGMYQVGDRRHHGHRRTPRAVPADFAALRDDQVRADVRGSPRLVVVGDLHQQRRARAACGRRGGTGGGNARVRRATSSPSTERGWQRPRTPV